MAVSIPYTTTWVSNQILTAAALNQNFLDVENISGLGTANIDANAGITGGQLAVGAAINTATSATVTSALTITTVETTVVTLPSVTVRGGRVIVFGFGGLTAVSISNTTTDITWRVYRGASVVQTIVHPSVGATPTGTFHFPIPLPIHSEVPAAGSYVYKITAQTGSANVAVVSDASANTGTLYLVELS